MYTYQQSIAKSIAICLRFPQRAVSPRDTQTHTHAKKWQTRALYGIVNAYPTVCFMLSFAIYSNLVIISFSFIRFLVLQVKYEDKAIFHSFFFFFRFLITRFVFAVLLSLCYHIAAWHYASLFISLPIFLYLARSISLLCSSLMRFRAAHFRFHSQFFLLFLSFFLFPQAPHSEIEKNLLLHMPFDIRLIGMSCEPSKFQIALSHFTCMHCINVPFRL